MAGDLQEAEVTKVAKCDFCEERHAFLYCKADSARLCLVCDHHVHSANPLSLKHARAPLCEYCKRRAATLQCEEETRFFCAACKEEQGVHNGEGHTISKSISFSGCILPGQLASAWKCQAPTSPFLEAFLSSKAVLDKACWTPDGSLSSILASHHWPNSLDSFLLSESNSCFADRSGSLNRYSGGQTAPKQVLLKQLEQLRRLQIEGDDFVAELQQECFRECMTHSSKQFCVPCDIVGGQTYADAQQQQEAADQHTFSYINSHPEQRSQSDNENSWNFSAEIKFPNTEVITGYDSCKPSSDAQRHLLLQDANELSWTISPTSMLVGMENANLRSKEQVFSAPDSYMHKMDRSKPNSISGAGVPVHANSSERSPREATGTLCFNEDMPTSSVQVSDLQVQHKPTNGRSSGFLNSGASLAACGGTPPSLDTEASAQARDSAMMRYKEKKKTRKFEKFVRYESRKARAETRLRVRGRFVKANGFNYESSLAGGVG